VRATQRSGSGGLVLDGQTGAECGCTDLRTMLHSAIDPPPTGPSRRRPSRPHRGWDV